MVVIKSASYSTRCPFTKTLIRPQNKICLFNESQFSAFEKTINQELNKVIPTEIVDIIIEKTGYKKLIGRFGHESVAHWTKKQSSTGDIINKPLKYVKECDPYDLHHIQEKIHEDISSDQSDDINDTMSETEEDSEEIISETESDDSY